MPTEIGPSPGGAGPAAAAAGSAPGRRIVVLRALQVGDMLCAVPALRALRAGDPRAHITLVGLPWARAFVARFTAYVDAFAEFPGHDGMPERPVDPEEARRFFASIRERRVDLALQMHGSGTVSNAVVAQFEARESAGFYPAGSRCPDPRRYARYPESGHEIRRLLCLTTLLGLPDCGEALEFPLTGDDFREFAALPEAPQLAAGDYACIHPGASVAAKRWPPERFAAVADALAVQGLNIVITGNGAEAPLARQLRAAMRAPAIDLARDISLGALAVVISRAGLLVANDTGVSHIAAALGTPSVIVFTAADVERWAPLDRARHRAVAVAVACRPCAHRVCPIGHPCALELQPDAVLGAAAEVLAYAERSARCSTS